MIEQSDIANHSLEPAHPQNPCPPKAWSIERLINGRFLLVLALAVCWFQFFSELRGEWTINPQYSFGYVVPLLVVILVWRRWPERPPAVPGNRVPVSLIAAGLLLLFLPLRIVIEANPEWRLLYWIHAMQVCGLSFCLLYRVGGSGWIRFFTAPLLFALIAVPWPTGLEQTVIQGLMRLVAGLTVETAGWLNIPAIQHGNLIEIGVGLVGIDEACSGVRSLQSALMISLFLGELYRFSFLRRAALVAGSLIFVLIANLARTTFLVWVAANRGLKQMESWHDLAGLLVMVGVLAGLVALAQWINPRIPREVLPRSTGAVVQVPFPRWAGVAVLIWLGLVSVATETWYRIHESTMTPTRQWTVIWPVENSQFKKASIPENSLAMLRCSESEAGSWEDEEGNQWSAFLLRWNPGKTSAQLSRGHRPEICFPAAGAEQVGDFGRLIVNVNGVEMPFRYQTFENGTALLHVFYCLWSDRVSPIDQPLLEDGSQISRIRAVIAGKRNVGQKALEVVVQGPDSSNAAIALLKSELPVLVKPD
jgi:exosortase